MKSLGETANDQKVCIILDNFKSYWPMFKVHIRVATTQFLPFRKNPLVLV